MSWSVEVDADTCIGSALCVGIAPEHFELVEGLSCPRRPEVAPAEEVTDAAQSCPVEAITMRDAGTGEVLAPER